MVFSIDTEDDGLIVEKRNIFERHALVNHEQVVEVGVLLAHDFVDPQNHLLHGDFHEGARTFLEGAGRVEFGVFLEEFLVALRVAIYLEVCVVEINLDEDSFEEAQLLQSEIGLGQLGELKIERGLLVLEEKLGQLEE